MTDLGQSKDRDKDRALAIRGILADAGAEYTPAQASSILAKISQLIADMTRDDYDRLATMTDRQLTDTAGQRGVNPADIRDSRDIAMFVYEHHRLGLRHHQFRHPLAI